MATMVKRTFNFHSGCIYAVTFLAVFSQPGGYGAYSAYGEAKQVEYYLQAASEVNEKYGLEVKWGNISVGYGAAGSEFSQVQSAGKEASS